MRDRLPYRGHDCCLVRMDRLIEIRKRGLKPRRTHTKGQINMTAEERNQRLSEVFDAMEAGEATTDDWWDATYTSVQHVP